MVLGDGWVSDDSSFYGEMILHISPTPMLVTAGDR